MANSRVPSRLIHAWNWAVHLGVDPIPDRPRRAIISTNQYSILAILGALPYVVVFCLLDPLSQVLPALTQLLMCGAWVLALFLNKHGFHLTAGGVSIVAPLLQFTFLASWYSVNAGFHFFLFAGGSLCLVAFPLERRVLRYTALGACIAALLLVELRWSDGVAAHSVRPQWIPGFAAVNIVLVVLLMYVVARFNIRYYIRERERNIALLRAAQTAAQTDALTDLFNRRGIAPILSSVARQGDYALALVDLDRFKIVNDRLGHGAGDVVLGSVAHSLVRSIGSRGTIARWGGEEFLVVMPGLTLRQADQLMERARAAIESEYAERDSASRITISVGLAHARQYASKDEALRLADANLYEAKSSGRNLVVSTRLADETDVSSG